MVYFSRMRQQLLLLFLLLQGWACFSQKNVDPLIDSLALAPKDKDKANIALKISRDLKDTDWKRSLHYIEYAEGLLPKIDSEEFSAHINYEIGEIYNDKDIFDAALTYFLKSYDYYSSQQKSVKEKYRVQNSLAIIYARLNNKDKAMFYFNNLLKGYKKEKDYESVAKAYNNIGNLYQNQDMLDSAMANFERSLALVNKFNNKHLEVVLYNNLGLSYTKKNQPAIASAYFKKAVTLVDTETDNDKNKAWIYNSIAKLYLLKNQADSALYYSLNAEKLLKGYQSSFENNYAQHNIYKSYLMLGDYKNAALYFEAYENLRDSLDIESKAMTVEKLKLEQEYKENEELRALKESESQFKYLLAGLGLVILLLVMAILLNRNRNKLQRAKLEKDLFESKKKELDANLELKNKELMTHSMMDIQRTEIVDQIVDDLKQLRLESPKKESRDTIDLIIKQLQKDNSGNELWKEFELRYGQVYEDFYNILSKKHPELTARDKRLCALLKLNLTTKEISSITGQTVKSLENARTRLRKKLDLTNTNQNLNNYLDSLV